MAHSIQKREDSDYRTICNVHRKIYQEVKDLENNGRIVELLKEAFDIGLMLWKILLEEKYGFYRHGIKKAERIKITAEFKDKVFKKNEGGDDG